MYCPSCAQAVLTVTTLFEAADAIELANPP
jgi:hypothetical protein